MRRAITVILLLLSVTQVVFTKNIKLGIMLPQTKYFNLFISGIKEKHRDITIVNLLRKKEKVDAVIAYENYIKKAEKLNKPIFAIVNCKCSVKMYNSSLIKMFYLWTVPLELQLKKFKDSFCKIKTFSVVVHERYILDFLKKEKIKNLKIFYAKNMGDVPYKIDLALKNSDALIAIPDKTVFNHFSTQFIFRKAILEGKPIITFSDEMFALGAYAAVLPDFAREGCRFCKAIKNFFKKQKNYNSLFIPKHFKIIFNKNISSKNIDYVEHNKNY